MIFLRLFCFLVPSATIWALMRRLTGVSGRALLALQVAVGVGTGLGLASCVYLIWHLAVGYPGSTYLLADTVFWSAGLAVCLRSGRRWRRSVPQVRTASTKASRILILTFSV